jgi:hypothetical protein
MTVENDGLSPKESAVAGSGDEFLDPPDDMLPLDGATARRVAAKDAAAWKAEMDAAAAAQPPPPPVPPPSGAPTVRMPPAAPPPPAPPAEPTEQLPPTVELPVQPEPGAATHVEGDLFDGQAGH